MTLGPPSNWADHHIPTPLLVCENLGPLENALDAGYLLLSYGGDDCYGFVNLTNEFDADPLVLVVVLTIASNTWIPEIWR